jgi:hypothetical protein
MTSDDKLIKMSRRVHVVVDEYMDECYELQFCNNAIKEARPLLLNLNKQYFLLLLTIETGSVGRLKNVDVGCYEHSFYSPRFIVSVPTT